MLGAHQRARRMTMNDRIDGTLSILAAFLVLFAAMLDPRIAAGIAILFLVGLSIYKFARHGAVHGE
jgi:hypothetical protein